ncbi:UNVERIFIED_CONTAM: hypothetical protein RMT77_017508 [Armadillidium vulgare]
MNIRNISKFLIFYLFYFCNIISCESKKCDYVSTFKEHLEFWEHSEEFSHYIPRQSCFICLQPSCKDDPRKCSVNELRELPLYHNMVEFGFLGNDLPVKASVRVPMSKLCYLLVI